MTLHRVAGRRAGALLLSGLTVLVGACQQGPAPLIDIAPGTARGANVLLVTMDTVRADHVGCYGRADAATPTLDRLCAEGIRFDNAVTPAPVTLPAHTSLLTGLTPPHHGVRYNAQFATTGKVATLADDLRGIGYYTAAVVGSFVLDRRFGLAAGFDDYDDRVAGQVARDGYVLRNERDADEVTARALDLLHASDRSKPFFLWVHYYDAHAPYLPHGTPGSLDERTRYAGEISHVDAALGKLLGDDAIAQSRTLIVVAADHGEGLGDHDERTHGLFLYDATTRVPLLLRLPDRQLAGRAVSDLVGLIDVRGSVRSLLGLPHMPIDGIDWLAARRGATDGVYQEAALPYFEYQFAPSYAWRGETERFIEAPEPEFYDLRADPVERSNLFTNATDSSQARANRLRQRLDAARLDGPTVPKAAAAMEQSDPATSARLRSLGYMGGGATPPDIDLPDAKSQVRVVNLHLDAVILLDAGKAEAALSLLRQARTLSPRNEAVLRLMSKAQLSLNLISEAEGTLRELLAVRRNPDSLVLLAQIHVLRDDFAVAETLLQQAEAMEPQHGGIAIARGDIALRKNDVGAAATYYQQAAAIDAARVGAIAAQRLQRLQNVSKK